MTDTDSEREVRAVLDAMQEAMNNGDWDAIASFQSSRADCTMIGTDPDEWLTGEQLRQLYDNMDEAMSIGGSPVRGVSDEAFVHILGEVAWVEGRGRLIDSAGRERAVRRTGVLLKEDGTWKGVQSHASIGVPNDQIFD